MTGVSVNEGDEADTGFWRAFKPAGTESKVSSQQPCAALAQGQSQAMRFFVNAGGRRLSCCLRRMQTVVQEGAEASIRAGEDFAVTVNRKRGGDSRAFRLTFRWRSLAPKTFAWPHSQAVCMPCLICRGPQCFQQMFLKWLHVQV